VGEGFATEARFGDVVTSSDYAAEEQKNSRSRPSYGFHTYVSRILSARLRHDSL
jgi:hypothetical protein